jgi:3-dehydroquinate synthase
MEGSRVSETLTIDSHKGPYSVLFNETALQDLNADLPENTHFIIDKRVAELYRDDMPNILSASSVLLVDATETSKSLDKFPAYVQHLVDNQIRRDHQLIAIGGGIIQDITCFLAATLLRGVTWKFYPTTLLSQADSCIGSKSSINCGEAKNILGTFTPPKEIHIATSFLHTLDERDTRSGVGEMIKVHVIDGPLSFDAIATDYDRLFLDQDTMVRYVRRALAIKKSYIEQDEFDQGPRNIFNYGHSFGHAIEAATKFETPHGIAVTIGMDMANWIAMKLGVGTQDHYQRMHLTLASNYRGFDMTPIPIDLFMSSISKDKKNVGAGVTLILPGSDARVSRERYANDDRFRALCNEYLEGFR